MGALFEPSAAIYLEMVYLTPDTSFRRNSLCTEAYHNGLSRIFCGSVGSTDVSPHSTIIMTLSCAYTTYSRHTVSENPAFLRNS